MFNLVKHLSRIRFHESITIFRYNFNQIFNNYEKRVTQFLFSIEINCIKLTKMNKIMIKS